MPFTFMPTDDLRAVGLYQDGVMIAVMVDLNNSRDAAIAKAKMLIGMEGEIARLKNDLQGCSDAYVDAATGQTDLEFSIMRIFNGGEPTHPRTFIEVMEDAARENKQLRGALTRITACAGAPDPVDALRNVIALATEALTATEQKSEG